MNYWTQSAKNIYVAAHRGWSTVYPENTMLAFRKACTLPIDQLETDVRVTKDGELVLIHDATVDRTTNGTGLVCEKTLKELRQFDAGGWKSEEFAGEKIPTFLEFMDFVKISGIPTLNVELKEYPTPGHEAASFDVCDRVLKIIEDYGYTDRVVINTFSGALHEYIHEKYQNRYRLHMYYPITHMGKKFKGDPYKFAYCCCMFRAFYSELNMAGKDEFARMAAMGVQPWAGTAVRDEKGVDLAIENGAQLITCNNPDVILELLQKKGYHE